MARKKETKMKKQVGDPDALKTAKEKGDDLKLQATKKQGGITNVTNVKKTTIGIDSKVKTAKEKGEDLKLQAIDVDSKDSVHPCAPFDNEKEFNDSNLRQQTASFFSFAKAPFLNMPVEKIYHHLLPSMKYYRNMYHKIKPLFLHGCGRSSPPPRKKQLTSFLQHVFSESTVDHHNIARNVGTNLSLFITDAAYNDGQTNPMIVAAVVFQMQGNVAIIDWLAVHNEKCTATVFYQKETSTTFFYQRQQLSTFLLYFLFKGLSSSCCQHPDLQVDNCCVWLQANPEKGGLQGYYTSLGFEKRTTLTHDNGYEIFKTESGLRIDVRDFIKTTGEAELFQCFLPNFGCAVPEPNSTNVIKPSAGLIKLNPTAVARAQKCYQNNSILMAKQRLSFNHNLRRKRMKAYNGMFDPVTLINKCKKNDKMSWVSYPGDSKNGLWSEGKNLDVKLQSYKMLHELMSPFSDVSCPLTPEIHGIKPADVSILSRLTDGPMQWLSRDHLMFMMNVMFRYNTHFDAIRVLSSEYSVIGKQIAVIETNRDGKGNLDDRCSKAIAENFKILYRMMYKDKNIDVLDSRLIFIIINQDECHWTVAALLHMDAWVNRLNLELDVSRLKKKQKVGMTLDRIPGLLYMDPKDPSGKGHSQLRTEDGVQALVNALFSLQCMHINFSNSSNITKKGKRMNQQAVNELIQKHCIYRKVLHDQHEQFQPSPNFKKFVFAESILAYQQPHDNHNCGVITLHSLMLVSKLLIDTVHHTNENWVKIKRTSTDDDNTIVIPVTPNLAKPLLLDLEAIQSFR